MRGWGWWRRGLRSTGTIDTTPPSAETAASSPRDWGLVWLVDDDPQQREMFQHSYRSARRWMPNANMHVWFTGQPLSGDCPQQRLRTHATQWAAKFDAWAQSPFSTTVFLDNDTIVLRDLEPIVRANPSVTALPYPNLLRRDSLPEGLRAGLPEQWRNVNSGVVVFHHTFMKHYRSYWRKLHTVANRVPGKDQYVFSLALHEWDRSWRPGWDLQVSSTPMAVDFLIRLWQVEPEPALGRVPFALIHQAYVFHATAEKAEYHQRFLNWFQLEAAHVPTPGGQPSMVEPTLQTTDD